MLTIGITGGIGSGKTTVTDMFALYGINIIDADTISRHITSENQQALKGIIEHFGDAYTLANGQLDRRKLRERIFSHPSDKHWLEHYLHPKVRQHIIEELERSTSPYCILSSPLLIETRQTELVDRVLVVDVTEQQQFERTTQRDNSSEDTVMHIMKSQCTRAERLEHADDVIDNSGNLEVTRQQVEHCHSKYLDLL